MSDMYLANILHAGIRKIADEWVQGPYVAPGEGRYVAPGEGRYVAPGKGRYIDPREGRRQRPLPPPPPAAPPAAAAEPPSPGKRLQVPQGPPRPPKGPPPPPPNKHGILGRAKAKAANTWGGMSTRSKLISGGAAGALALGGSTLIGYFLAKTPEDVLEEIEELEAAGDEKSMAAAHRLRQAAIEYYKGDTERRADEAGSFGAAANEFFREAGPGAHVGAAAAGAGIGGLAGYKLAGKGNETTGALLGAGLGGASGYLAMALAKQMAQESYNSEPTEEGDKVNKAKIASGKPSRSVNKKYHEGRDN